MNCDMCGVEEAIPFKCRYCEGNFCSLHRLPPNHSCPFLRDYLQQPSRARKYLQNVTGEAGSPRQRLTATIRNTVLIRFSAVELAHLAIATFLITLVGLAIYGYRFHASFIAIFIGAFVAHELAHKFLAQFYRAWAEFRVILFGAALTLLSAIPFWPFTLWPIKFIAPGAVMVSGNLSMGRNGKVSWIGPATNIAMCAGFLIAYILVGRLTGHSSPILLVGAQFNGIIALFNLIPFMGLDGEKIFWWNKAVWILTVAGAGALYLAVDFMAGGPFSRLFMLRH